LDSNYQSIAESLETAYYNLAEHQKEIKSLIGALDFDDETFNQYQERLFELAKYETKYQKSIDELVDYLVTIKDELEMSKDYDGYLKRSLSEASSAYQKAYEQGIKLSDERKRLAAKMQKSLVTSLYDLDLEKAKFEISF